MKHTLTPAERCAIHKASTLQARAVKKLTGEKPVKEKSCREKGCKRKGCKGENFDRHQKENATVEAWNDGCLRDQEISEEYRFSCQKTHFPEVSLANCPELQDRFVLSELCCHGPPRSRGSLFGWSVWTGKFMCSSHRRWPLCLRIYSWCRESEVIFKSKGKFDHCCLNRVKVVV